MSSLTRAGLGLATPPVRSVHLGLGAFHRAHQAWYTHAADPEWGIAAFTGRDAAAADLLAPQDGLYTLIERGPSSDEATIVGSVVEALDGSRVDRLVELLAAESTALVTLTVTEAGYRLTPDGRPDESDPHVVADLAGAAPSTPLGRLVAGLGARRSADAPLAIVPCDNIPGNGEVVRRGLLAFAERRDPALAEWISERVSFVSTSVDRITPRLSDDDRGVAASLTGWDDAAPVITEPFRDWTLSGDFPLGRPRWEHAGARFVDDIEPFENRKLWLLNGAHSLLAELGRVRGHRVVAEAIADESCREAVDRFWSEATRVLDDESLDLDRYRESLLARFGNARIRHELDQIAMDAPTKLRLRIIPVARAERAVGNPADGCATAIAAWCTTSGQRDVRAATARLDAELAADGDFIATISAELTTIERNSP
jgi:fructuronate reductase